MFKCQTKYFVCIVHELKINLRMYTSVWIREFCKAICDIKLMLYMYLSISCIYQNLQKKEGATKQHWHEFEASCLMKVKRPNKIVKFQVLILINVFMIMNVQFYIEAILFKEFEPFYRTTCIWNMISTE